MTAETTSSRPTIAQRANDMICPNCGGEAKRKSEHGPSPVYCSPECKRAKGNRDLARGSAIITLAQGWRIDRGSGEIAQRAFQEFVAVLDRFNAEDREAGRPRADLAAAKLMNSGTRYIDRCKR